MVEFIVHGRPDFVCVRGAVKIEVMHVSARRGVFVEEAKGGAGCFAGICAPTGRQTAHKVRFARAQIPDERYGAAGTEPGRQGPPGLDGFLRRCCLKSRHVVKLYQPARFRPMCACLCPRAF